MADSTVSIFEEVKSIADVWPVNTDPVAWPDAVPSVSWEYGGHNVTPRGRFTFNVAAYPVCATNGSEAIDYYFLQVNGMVNYALPPPLQFDGFTVSIQPSDEFMLYIDSSPNTSVGSDTVQVNTTSTISGSLGFFSDSPTASVGMSMSTSKSRSFTLPDVTVTNNSLNVEQNAEWLYVYGEGAPSIHGGLNHSEEVLYRIERTRGVTLADFSVTLSLHVSNQEDGNTDLFDDYVRALGAAGAAFSFDPGQSKKGTISIPSHMVRIAQPPVIPTMSS